jgi:synaptotagmin-like protein
VALVIVFIFFSSLQYKIERQFLKTQKLNLSVWHRDTFKRNSFLGEVELDLETWDWDSKQNKQLKWYPLKRKVGSDSLLCVGERSGVQGRAR